MKTPYHKLILCITLVLCLSCKQNKIQTISSDEAAGLPTENVDSLRIVYTENGKLKNEIIAKTANNYKFADTPYIQFPDGMHARSLTEGDPESDIVADSVVAKGDPIIYIVAYGNVVLRNFKNNSKMETQGPLFWDLQNKSIHTDAYAVIYNDGDTIKAHNGMVSDEQFRIYELRSLKESVLYKEFEKNTETSTETEK